MKKYLGISVSLIALLAPASLVFADTHGDTQGHTLVGTSATIQVNADSQANVDTQTDLQGNIDENNTDEGDLNTVDEATTTMKQGDKKDSHTDEATSTENQGEHGHGGGNGVFASFWSWLFGLPATTTVGDIRTQLQASTTASSSAGVHTQADVGFFGHLLQFFHFGD